VITNLKFKIIKFKLINFKMVDKCIISMAIIITLLDYCQYMPPAFYPIYAVNKKHISLELTGLIISVQTFVSIFVSLLATKYTNKFNRNNLILFSLFISGIGNIGFVSLEFTENKNTIVVLSFIFRCLSGVGLAIGNSVIYAYIPILYKS